MTSVFNLVNSIRFQFQAESDCSKNKKSTTSTTRRLKLPYDIQW